MANMAIAYHAASDDHVGIMGVQDGTATVRVLKIEKDGVTQYGEVFEIAYDDLSRVTVDGAVIEAFDTLAQVRGGRSAQDSVRMISGTEAWAHEVWCAWMHCYH